MSGGAGLTRPQIDRALNRVVQGWSTPRVARELMVAHGVIEHLLADIGGQGRARQALAEVRAGLDPRVAARAPQATAPAAGAVDGLRTVPTDQVHANPDNIRADLGDLDELAASLVAQGQLQPALAHTGPGDGYTLIDGHRRLAAARRAGLMTFNLVVTGRTRGQRETATMLAAAMHKQLTPLEQAAAFQRLVDQGWEVDEIAYHTGYATATVRTRLVLLQLPTAAQDMVRTKQLTLGDADKLARQVKATRAGSTRVTVPRSSYFTRSHPLAKDVTEACTHGQTRVPVGHVGCGQCWESHIAAAALDGAVHMVDDLTAAEQLADLADQHRRSPRTQPPQEGTTS